MNNEDNVTTLLLTKYIPTNVMSEMFLIISINEILILFSNLLALKYGDLFFLHSDSMIVIFLISV